MSKRQGVKVSRARRKPEPWRAKCRGYKKILIVRLDRIGDVVLSTPVIQAVREAYPESHISFLVRPYARDVVKGNPDLNEVIVYDKNRRERGLFGNLSFLSRLRRGRYDLVIILHPTRRTHLLVFLAGIPERIGYDKKFGFLLTRRIPHLKQLGLKHEIDYTLDLVRYLGISRSDRRPSMPLSDASEGKIRALFASHGIGAGELVIALHPGASCPSKKWMAENYASVGAILAEKHKARIVVIAGVKDKSIGDSVASSLGPAALNLSGKTTVSDLASILSRSRLLISNDSGPVHIACAVGTPVIAIFGRSDRGLSPKRWGPTGEKDIALHKDVGCEICLAHNCKIEFECLKAVTVDEVVAAAERILGE